LPQITFSLCIAHFQAGIQGPNSGPKTITLSQDTSGAALIIPTPEPTPLKLRSVPHHKVSQPEQNTNITGFCLQERISWKAKKGYGIFHTCMHTFGCACACM